MTMPGDPWRARRIAPWALLLPLVVLVLWSCERVEDPQKTNPFEPGNLPDFNLVAVLSAHHDTVSLSWDAVAGRGVRGYRLFRYETSAEKVIEDALADVPDTVLTYDDDTIIGGTTYLYKVAALDAAGRTSDVEGQEGVEVQVLARGRIEITTTPDEAPWTIVGPQLDEEGSGDTVYEDQLLGSYTITWLELEGWERPDPVGQTETLASGDTLRFSGVFTVELPAAPSGLTALAVSSSQIDLSWTDNADNEMEFKIERSATSNTSGFTQIATVGANVTTFSDTGLAEGTQYWYRVRATNTAGDSDWSNVATATTAVGLPAAPTTLFGYADAIHLSQVNLTWADNADNETGFKIERSSGSSTWGFELIGIVGANVTSYSDTGLDEDTRYWYRVRTMNEAGDSDWSNVVSPFILIPPGTFLMGSPEDEPGRRTHEGPQQQVTLTQGFYMSRYEVTEQWWYQVMGGTSTTSQLPKGSVSWDMAVQFCNALSIQEGLTPAYTIHGPNGDVIWNQGANGYRLPTEAEWEFACRAGSTTAFANGPLTGSIECDPIDPNLDAMGWYCGNNSPSGRKPVGQKQANQWGLYDMHGNVYEWVWCGWLRVYTSDAVVDPVHDVDSGDSRVLRGGSSNSQAQYCRSANRVNHYPPWWLEYNGFRLARSTF